MPKWPLSWLLSYRWFKNHDFMHVKECVLFLVDLTKKVKKYSKLKWLTLHKYSLVG